MLNIQALHLNDYFQTKHISSASKTLTKLKCTENSLSPKSEKKLLNEIIL